jgi:cell division septum initiation protein DivIVA
MVGGTRDFRTALLGYDREEVDAFRDEVDAMVAELRLRIDELTEELELMRREKPITADQAFANVARETQRILQSAQEAGARMITESREQAESELAHARHERSQIVGDGYRARDEMSEQLRELAQARIAMVRRLEEATAEVERVCAGLATDDDPTADARRVLERARTGTDGSRAAAGAPGGGAALRVIPGEDDGRSGRGHQRALRPAPMPAEPSVGDPLTEKRDQLAPLRIALIERLTDELGALRDELRARIRRSSDAGEQAVAIDLDPLVGAVAESGTTHLRRAFELGAGAAAADVAGLVPAERPDGVDAPLFAVLRDRVGAPISELLAEATAADDPPWVLVERIDGIVSDASAAMVAPIAESRLSDAYERGKLATWTGGDVTARRWIVSPRGHRSDDPCRANVRAGAIDVQAPFPSGDVAPPRFDGCTCTTAAATKETDP